LAGPGGHALTNDDDAQPRRVDHREQEVLLHPALGFAREFESVEDEEGGRRGTIPIVFAAVIDPVASGIIARLNQPGGNTTGFANSGSLAGRQVA
jgi:hypothetical protein